MTLDPALTLLLALSAAALFAGAALHKLRSVATFATVVAAYRIVPTSWVAMTARAVLTLEFACAAGLLVGSLRARAAAVGAGLILAYGCAIAINLFRGRVDIDCGCAGFGRRRSLAAWMVIRNAVIAALLLAMLADSRPRALVWTDMLTVLGGAIVMASLYAAIDTLLGQSAQLVRHAEPARTPRAYS